jgi:galactose mutarotase-like enzyme
MNGSDSVGSGERHRVLNTVRLQNAVLCAECDVVSDSPHDTCLVCGSHSLFNVARIFGGNLPQKRVRLIAREEVEIASREVVLPFPKPHRLRRRTTSGSRQATVLSFGENAADEDEREGIVGPKAR